MAREVMLDQLPVHQPGKADQRMLHVELLIQARTEHLGGLGGAGVGLHGLPNLQESAGPVFVSLQISHHTSTKIALQINGLRVVQGGLAMLVRRDGETLNALLKRLDKAIGRFYEHDEIIDEVNGN